MEDLMVGWIRDLPWNSTFENYKPKNIFPLFSLITISTFRNNSYSFKDTTIIITFFLPDYSLIQPPLHSYIGETHACSRVRPRIIERKRRESNYASSLASVYYVRERMRQRPTLPRSRDGAIGAIELSKWHRLYGRAYFMCVYTCISASAWSVSASYNFLVLFNWSWLGRAVISWRLWQLRAGLAPRQLGVTKAFYKPPSSQFWNTADGIQWLDNWIYL